jgi:hypothetical protein
VPVIEASMGRSQPFRGVLYLYSGKYDNKPSTTTHLVEDGGVTWQTRTFLDRRRSAQERPEVHPIDPLVDGGRR